MAALLNVKLAKVSPFALVITPAGPPPVALAFMFCLKVTKVPPSVSLMTNVDTLVALLESELAQAILKSNSI